MENYRDDEASVELRGVSGTWVARAAQRREEGRQLADAAEKIGILIKGGLRCFAIPKIDFGRLPL